MNDGLGLGQGGAPAWSLPLFTPFPGKTRKAWLIVDGGTAGLTVLDQSTTGLFTSSSTSSYSTVYTVATGTLTSQNGTIIRVFLSGNGNGYNCSARATLNSGATQLTVETYANSATPGSVASPVYIEFWA